MRDATNNRIDELFPEGSITHHTRLVITNAVYFLADWNQQFESDYPTDRPFTRLDGDSETVPMMQLIADFRIGIDHEAGYQTLEFPYVGDDRGMVVVLPAEMA